MSLQSSSLHPLASSSRPTSPAAPPPSSSLYPYQADGPSTSSAYLTPSANTSVTGTPPRVDSPMLTSRRRRNGAPTDSTGGYPGGPNTHSFVQEDEDYDAKRRGASEAGPSRPRGATLNRLESFFGQDFSTEAPRTASGSLPISNGTSVPRHKGPAAGSSQSVANPGTRLVLQHTVAATDTLQGIALRYKTDVSTLRKVNGLWPGDSAMTRKVIWVPLDRCREHLSVSPDAKVGLQGADGGSVTEATSSSSLIGMSPPSERCAQSGLISSPLHERTNPLSNGASEISDFSSSGGLGSSAVGRDSPPVVRRLPSEVLGHFPATARGDILTVKGKTRADQWNEELTAARPQHRLGAGPGMSGYDPGESGLEDLLQLAREAKGSGGETSDKLQPTAKPAEEVRSEEICEETADKEKWTPNVWKFGERQRSGGASGSTMRSSELGHTSVRGSLESSTSKSDRSSSPSKALRPLKLVDKSIEEWAESSNVGRPASQRDDHVPAAAAAAAAAESTSPTYAGWNDIPPLHAYAKGRVVEAYAGSGTGSGRGVNGKRRAMRANHRFLDDLAAGLPPNAGAASKWARPIGESLPNAPGGARGGVHSSGLPSAVGGGSTSTAAGKKSSLRGLLSDALRGRVALDEALSKGFEEMLNRSEGWDSLPHEEMEQARRLGLLSPAASGPSSPKSPSTLPSRLQHTMAARYSDRPRISAEEARKTLARRPSPQGGAGGLGGADDDVPLPSQECNGHPTTSTGPTGQDSSILVESQGRRRTQMEMESLDENHHSRRNVYTATMSLSRAAAAAAVRGEEEVSGVRSKGEDSLMVARAADAWTGSAGPMLRKISSRTLVHDKKDQEGEAVVGSGGAASKWGW